MAHALIIAILYCFYRPKRHPKVLESKFDSTNHDVICFCLVVAFTTLHVVKFGVHAVLSLAHEYDNRMHEINNAGVELPLPLIARDSLSRPDNTRAGGTGNVAEEGGMCARCIANMVNNNSPIPPPPTTTPTANNQNNNETIGFQPQGESGQGNAMEQIRANEKEGKGMNDDNQKARLGDIVEQKPQCSGEEDVKGNSVDLGQISASAVNKSCMESRSSKNLLVETRIEILDPCN